MRRGGALYPDWPRLAEVPGVVVWTSSWAAAWKPRSTSSLQSKCLYDPNCGSDCPLVELAELVRPGGLAGPRGAPQVDGVRLPTLDVLMVEGDREEIEMTEAGGLLPRKRWHGIRASP
jgi:hypothetical protein